MAFYSGSYRAVFNDLDLGQVEDGFTLTYRRSVENILTDAGGDAPVDAVHRGVTATLSFILSEWNNEGMEAVSWPFRDSSGNIVTYGETGRIGILDNVMAKILVLTACDANNDPATITFPKAVISPDFDVTILFANRHRKIPIQMTLYPALINNTSTNLQCEERRLFVTT